MRDGIGARPFTDELLGTLYGNAAQFARVEVVRGDTIYNHGERESSLYVVESGQVNATAHTVDGKRCLLDICTRGDVVGELGLLGHDRQETVTAMEDSVLQKVRAVQLLGLLESARLAESFIQHLLSRLVEQQQTITNLVTMDSEHRLAATLLRIAARRGTRMRSGTVLGVRLTHEELASMVGTTRSRIGLFLKGFRESGLVMPLPGPFLTVDENGLAAFIGNDPPPPPATPPGALRNESIEIPFPRASMGCDFGPESGRGASNALHRPGSRRHARLRGHDLVGGRQFQFAEREARLRAVPVPKWVR